MKIISERKGNTLPGIATKRNKGEKVLISSIDRWIQRIPGINTYYTRYYGTLRNSFYKINRKLHLVKTPLYVHWLATYDCNFDCRHCEAYPGQRTIQELTTEQISRAVCDMGDMGVKTLIFTGGEPLLRKDIFQIISLARERGIKNIYMATNGYLVNKFKEQLREVHLDKVYISIDGCETTNDRFRGVRGAFRKALEGLAFFEEIGVNERVVNTLTHQGNLDELDTLREEIVDSSATSWNIQTALPVGRARSASHIYLSPQQIQYVFDFIEESRKILETQLAVISGHVGKWGVKLRSRPFFCGAGLETCSIMPDGEVLGCHVVYDNTYSEGNIKDMSFKYIWEMRNGRFRQPDLKRVCRDCKVYHACRGGCWAARLGDRPCIIEMC